MHNADLVYTHDRKNHGILKVEGLVQEVNFFNIVVDKPFYAVSGKATLKEISNLNDFRTQLEQKIHELSNLTGKDIENNILLDNTLTVNHNVYKRTPPYTPRWFTSRKDICVN